MPSDRGHLSSSRVTRPVPGMHDTSPAARWADGFRTANGEQGAVLYGEPAMERVVFDHRRQASRQRVLPEGSTGVLARALAEDFASAGSYRPAYEFRISSPGMTAAGGYGRVTDFRTGEVISTWTDEHGTWARRAFASRADQVIVHELLPAPGRTVDTTLSAGTAPTMPPAGPRCTTKATVSNGSGYLYLRSAPSADRCGAGYEGVTRVVAVGGSVYASGSTLVVIGAIRLLLLTRLDRCETPTGWISHALRTALAGLGTDYPTLFARHTAAIPA